MWRCSGAHEWPDLGERRRQEPFALDLPEKEERHWADQRIWSGPHGAKHRHDPVVGEFCFDSAGVDSAGFDYDTAIDA